MAKFATAFLLLWSGSYTVCATRGPPASRPIILRDLAKPRYVGTAANTSFLFTDEKYTQLALTQFSMYTPENEMKWESIEPQPGLFNFGPADEIVRTAHRIGAKMHGHTFMWGNQLAPWVNSSLTATQLDRALKNHITTILNHYRGQLYAFDIINEMISDNTPTETYKNNVWTQKFGESAMAKALTYARAVDKRTKLYINEYGIEGINSKSDALYSIVKSFLADGIPVDGVGFQCHFRLGGVPTDFQANLQRFVDLGVEVAITELDINMRGAPNATSLAQQAKDYYSVVDACVKTKRCVSVTVWGISDEHSWIPNGAVLPWDAQKQPKPAFFAMADAFQGKPSP